MKKTLLVLALFSISASATVDFFIGTVSGSKSAAISEMKKYDKKYASTKNTTVKVVKKYTKWRVQVIGVKNQKHAKALIKDLNLKHVIWNVKS